MDRWRSISPGYWRQEVGLPVGYVVAEIRKQAYLPLYSARVCVTVAARHIPQELTKTAIGLLNVAEAQLVCHRLVTELVNMNRLAPAGGD
jgi:hypothetical protein